MVLNVLVTSSVRWLYLKLESVRYFSKEVSNWYIGCDRVKLECLSNSPLKVGCFKLSDWIFYVLFKYIGYILCYPFQFNIQTIEMILHYLNFKGVSEWENMWEISLALHTINSDRFCEPLVEQKTTLNLRWCGKLLSTRGSVSRYWSLPQCNTPGRLVLGEGCDVS